MYGCNEIPVVSIHITSIEKENVKLQSTSISLKQLRAEGASVALGEPEIFSAIAANVAHVVQAIITRTGIVSAPYLELVGAKAIIGSSRSFSGNAA